MRLKFIKTTVATLILGIFMALGMTTEADAFYNVKQTDSKVNSASISWERGLDEAYYELEIGKISHYWSGNTYHTDTDWVTVGTTYGTSYTFTGLLGGESYSFMLTSYDADGNWVSYSTFSGMYTLPGKVELYRHQFKWGYAVNKQTQYYNLYLGFIEEASAEGYEVKLMNYKGKKIKTKKIKSTGAMFYYPEFTKLKEDMYCIQVRAYTTYKGKKVYGKWSNKAYVLQAPKCKARYKSKKVQIAWDKIKGASGYDIYMCTKKNGTYKKVASVSSKKSSVYVKKYGSSKIKKNKTYYYYVVAKKKSGNKVYKSEINYRYKVRT
ncbi:MAG: fibronectin type III domain-containing protein [Lachnospiraceae bacterium]|nr:fibronectin type III domain-containing protein [Lachnospiraceae bacterium]